MAQAGAARGTGSDTHQQQQIQGHQQPQWVTDHNKLAAQMFPRRAVPSDETAQDSPKDKQEQMLHCAASQGITFSVLAMLADGNSACDLVDRYGRTALHWASEQGHPDVVRALLRSGACIDPRSLDKSTPLMLAALRGNKEIVDLLLCAGADESDRGLLRSNKSRRFEWKSTALHYASVGGHLEVVSMLLDAGFDREQHDGAGQTPAERSAIAPHASSPLLTSRLLPRDGGGKLLHSYVDMIMEDVGMVAGLVLGGAFLNWQDAFGNTPLHRAVHFQHVTTTKILLAAGAVTNLVNAHRQTPLHGAVVNGCVPIVAALLEAGADTEARTILGQCPLHLAVIHNNVDIVALLLNAGACLESRGHGHSKAPLLLASIRCLAPIIRLLSEAGADVESRSPKGVTPLHWACRFNSPDCVETLLKAGADPDAIDEAAAQAASAVSMMGLPNPPPLAARPAAADVIGLGDPSHWAKNPRLPFPRELARMAEQRLDAASKLRIISALSSAKRDRTWRRRGWLVILAKRRMATTVPGVRTRMAVGRGGSGMTYLGGAVIDAKCVGKRVYSTAVGQEKEAAGVPSRYANAGKKDSKTHSSDTTRHGQHKLTARTGVLCVHACDVCKRPKCFCDTGLTQATPNRNGSLGRGNGNERERTVIDALKQGTSDSCELVPEVMEGLLELAAVGGGVFRNVVSFI